MRTAASKVKSNLEREVILAVVFLYLMICALMLAIHYLQPTAQETRTSSTSPSHEQLREEALPSERKK